MFITRYTKQLLIVAALIYAVTLGTVIAFGIPLGIDFTGGALTEVSYDERPEKEVLESQLATLELGGYSLRGTTEADGREGYILRTRELSESERQTLTGILTSEGTGGTIGRFTSIGPVIGEERVSKPVGSWVYGGITILVLLHDVLVPTALIAVLGYFLGLEADVLFVMALLAVLGYSVNDTIVVFDRVRENLMWYRDEKEKIIKEAGVERTEVTYTLTRPFEKIVGESVRQTMGRSINTSLTTLIALTALYLLGGDVTKTFALVLIAGVIAGTYSSIAIANPLLIAIANRQARKQGK